MSSTDAKVLVVDDDPQILRAVRTSLGAHGFEVSTAGNGETAVDMLGNRSTWCCSTSAFRGSTAWR